jgi:tetratricopeptide (TPR) repeat protein
VIRPYRLGFSCTILAVLLMGSSGVALADKLTEQADALLSQGKAQAAYELLTSEESARAGDLDYDLLLGIAALEAGKNTDAVMALERVLALQPDHARARAEIARAYLALGETRAARREFGYVKNQPVSDEVRRAVDRFLAAIDRIDPESRTMVRGFAELAIGHDTNVNAGPSGSQVAVPLFGGAVFTLNNMGTSQSDSFTNAAAGISLRSPLASNLDLIANLAANKRINGTHDTFDTGNLDGNVGIAYSSERDVYSLSLQAGTMFLDNARYRDNSGFTAQWQRNLDLRNQVSLFLQHGWLRYPSQPLRDTDRTVIGMGAAHALADRKTVFYGGLYLGHEDEKRSAATHIGHTLWGLRIGGQHQLRDDVAAFANLAYENRRFGGSDPFFLKKRDDDQLTLGIGIAWEPLPQWRVTPQFTHTYNNSNIPINDYKRDMISVTVRRTF